MKQLLITGLMALGLALGVGPAIFAQTEGDHHEHEAAGGQEHIVKMLFDEETGDVLFEPARIEIKSGDTVTWVQVDEFNEHNVVSYPDGIPKGAELFEGPLLNEVGQKYSVTFTTSGTYRYHCHPHEAVGMRGTVIVDRESLPGEFREADPSEVHDHGGGMVMDHDDRMKMDMDGGHGDDDRNHGAKPEEGHGHDEGGAGRGDTMASMDMPGENSGHAHPEPSDENLAAFEKAFQGALASGDFDTVAASFAGDARVFEGGKAEADLEGYLENHLKPEMPIIEQLNREVLSQVTHRDGGTAWISTEARIWGNLDEREIDVSQVETMNLVFDHDSWKIAHVHWSSRPNKKE